MFIDGLKVVVVFLIVNSPSPLPVASETLRPFGYYLACNRDLCVLLVEYYLKAENVPG